MDRKRLATPAAIALGTVILAMSLNLLQARPEAPAEHPSHADTSKMTKSVRVNALSLHYLRSLYMPMASHSIDKAIEAVKTGDSATALEELEQARAMLAAITGELGNLEEPTFANTHCPVMGWPINPWQVAATDLTREFDAQKVAFCCWQCPVTWDELSESEKTNKLARYLTDSS